MRVIEGDLQSRDGWGVAIFKSWAIDAYEKKGHGFLARDRQAILYSRRSDAKYALGVRRNLFPDLFSKARVVRVQVTVKIVGE